MCAPLIPLSPLGDPPSLFKTGRVASGCLNMRAVIRRQAPAELPWGDPDECSWRKGCHQSQESLTWPSAALLTMPPCRISLDASAFTGPFSTSGLLEFEPFLLVEFQLGNETRTTENMGPDVRLELKCPGCDRPFFVPPSEQGRVSECPHCGGWVDVPEVGREPTTAELDEAAALRSQVEYDRQQAEYIRQLELGARQLEQAQRSLDAQDQLNLREAAKFDRLNRLLEQWESLAERASRVLDRMESGR